MGGQGGEEGKKKKGVKTEEKKQPIVTVPDSAGTEGREGTKRPLAKKQRPSIQISAIETHRTTVENTTPLGSTEAQRKDQILSTFSI